MKKIALMLVALALMLSPATALAAHPARDWTQFMPTIHRDGNPEL